MTHGIWDAAESCHANPPHVDQLARGRRSHAPPLRRSRPARRLGRRTPGISRPCTHRFLTMSAEAPTAAGPSTAGASTQVGRYGTVLAPDELAPSGLPAARGTLSDYLTRQLTSSPAGCLAGQRPTTTRCSGRTAPSRSTACTNCTTGDSPRSTTDGSGNRPCSPCAPSWKTTWKRHCGSWPAR